ncbi:phenylalanine--tRNA ligase subunit alpha, partial [bacterium]|nr:phenylalanine--tRNA ligase subunit alpha [bacterium]
MVDMDGLREGFFKDAESCLSQKDTEALRLKYLGRKGLLAQFREGVDFKSLTPEMRGAFGKGFNDLKNLMEKKVEELTVSLKNISESAKRPQLDMTLPGSGHSLGSLHPITLVQMELEEIFKSMGFYIETGYEVEEEYYNFDALNTPFDHPAREMQDTFWLTNGLVMRTQTSAVQVRALEKYGAPMKMIAPGRCFRYETVDANHENTFYQLEGLMVDRNISVANLICVMNLLLEQVFR